MVATSVRGRISEVAGTSPGEIVPLCNRERGPTSAAGTPSAIGPAHFPAEGLALVKESAREWARGSGLAWVPESVPGLPTALVLDRASGIDLEPVTASGTVRVRAKASVIDLVPGSPTEYHVVQHIGFPRVAPR